ATPLLSPTRAEKGKDKCPKKQNGFSVASAIPTRLSCRVYPPSANAGCGPRPASQEFREMNVNSTPTPMPRVLCLLRLAAGPTAPQAGRPAERETARRLDAALAAGLAKDATPPVADDETFLRRVSLDLTGKLPGPEDVRAFVASTDPDKRARLIDRLLTS